MNPMNTPFEIKRLLGRRFKDPQVQRDLERFPYKVRARRRGGERFTRRPGEGRRLADNCRGRPGVASQQGSTAPPRPEPAPLPCSPPRPPPPRHHPQVDEAKDGSVLVHVRYGGEDKAFTPEQIMAMIIVDLKKIAEKEGGAPVVDCSLSVPVFYTERERRSMLAATQVRRGAGGAARRWGRRGQAGRAVGTAAAARLGAPQARPHKP
jgi:hypothetical protein